MKIRKTFVAVILSVIVLSGILFFTRYFLTNSQINDNKNNSSKNVSQFQEIPFTRLTIKELEEQKSGSSSAKGTIPKQDIVFKNLTAWRDFWDKYSNDKVKEVDFEKQTVAGVFLGEKPSSGYGIEIKKILFDSIRNHTQIQVMESIPSADQGQLSVITYPSDMVMFPAHSGTVEFIRIEK